MCLVRENGPSASHVIILNAISRELISERKTHLSHLFVSCVNAPSCFWPVPEVTLQTAYRTVKTLDIPLTTFLYSKEEAWRSMLLETNSI